MQIISLEWGDYMALKIKYKKIITLLLIGAVLMVGFLMYKEQTTNKEVPKKAHFVKNRIEWKIVYG